MASATTTYLLILQNFCERNEWEKQSKTYNRVTTACSRIARNITWGFYNKKKKKKNQNSSIAGYRSYWTLRIQKILSFWHQLRMDRLGIEIYFVARRRVRCEKWRHSKSKSCVQSPLPTKLRSTFIVEYPYFCSHHFLLKILNATDMLVLRRSRWRPY